MYDLSRKTKARGDNALGHRMGEGRKKERKKKRTRERITLAVGIVRRPFLIGAK